MAISGFDGSINIDTSIDGRGLTAGLNALMGTIGKLGAAIGIAFGVGAIVQFGKSSVQAANQLESSLAGLRFMVNATGRDFSEAQNFLNDFTADGLVPMTNATEAYKNMLSRGYDTSQIEDMMNIMKDSAVYNRQAAFSVGEAIEKTTQGLRMENSMLTDSVGIQKNVAKMWKEYAESIGTTANNLNEAQKRQAEYNGFMAEGGVFAGAAAEYANTYAGRVSKLSASFYNLRVAVGKSIIPVISSVLPYIQAAVDALTIWFNRLALIMSVLFGVDISEDATNTEKAMDGAASSTNAAADAQDELAKNTEKAGKAAKGALASFDSLNVLQQDTGEAGAVTLPEIGSGSGGSGKSKKEEKDPALLALEKQIDEFKKKMASLFAPAIEAFGRLKTAAMGLADTIGKGLAWAWENVLKPIGEWAIRTLAPVFIDLLAAAINLINEALKAMGPDAEAFYNNFLVPIAEWTGGVIIDILEWLVDRLNDLTAWIKENPETFATIIEVLGSFALAFIVVTSAVNLFKSTMTAATGIISAVSGAIGFLTSPIGLVILALGALIAIIVLVAKNWDWVKETAGNVWAFIVATYKGAYQWVRDTIVEPVTSAFGKAFDWIGAKWNSVLTGVKNFGKNIINSVIGFVNGMISAVAGGLNFVISKINALSVTVPSWVPGIGGNTWGVNIPPVTAYQIPMLASGAVVQPNQPQLAILGDHRSQRELVAPEDMIRQIVREETQGQNYTGPQAIDNRISINGREIYREMKRIENQQGASLIKGAQPI